jgi:ribosomal protein S6
MKKVSQDCSYEILPAKRPESNEPEVECVLQQHEGSLKKSGGKKVGSVK